MIIIINNIIVIITIIRIIIIIFTSIIIIIIISSSSSSSSSMFSFNQTLFQALREFDDHEEDWRAAPRCRLPMLRSGFRV